MTRMCLHMLDAVRKGANNIHMCTVDTDGVILLIIRIIILTIILQLLSYNSILQLWGLFGKSRHFLCNFISLWHKNSAKKVKVSSFARIYGGRLGIHTINESVHRLRLLERFTCILNDGTTESYSVNQLRELFFTK